MRRYSGGPVSGRGRGAIAPAAAFVAAAWLAVAAAPAGATITPIPSPHTSTGASAAVQAAVDPAKFPLGRIAAAFYTGASKTLSVPPNGNRRSMRTARRRLRCNVLLGGLRVRSRQYEYKTMAATFLFGDSWFTSYYENYRFFKPAHRLYGDRQADRVETVV